MTEYPITERIIEINLLSITIIKAKKADQSKLLSYSKLSKIVDDCKKLDGDVYDKAALLMKSLVQEHPFASGNRRTAFLATKDFLLKNNAKFSIKDEPQYARVMLGIRERFYSDSEIKEWIKNGKINEFKR